MNCLKLAGSQSKSTRKSIKDAFRAWDEYRWTAPDAGTLRLGGCASDHGRPDRLALVAYIKLTEYSDTAEQTLREHCCKKTARGGRVSVDHDTARRFRD